MNSPKNILIVRTDRIGDVVLTLPLAGILKKAFPQSKVTFMVREYTQPLAEAASTIDEVLLYDEKYPFDKTLIELKSKKFDTCIVVHPRFRLAFLLYLSGIKVRIGTGYRWYSFLFNKKVFEHRKYGTNHELIHNLNLLKQLGIEADTNEGTVVYNLQVEEKKRQKIRSVLTEHNIDFNKQTVIIHPGSGGSAVDLPFSHFQELISKLAQELDINILLTGSKEEKTICENLMNNKKTYNLAGIFNLDELMALISDVDLLIANSTGPIHIAAALGKNVIGFYPKVASCSVTRWGPYTDKRTIFTPEIECSNCTTEQCAKLNCMSSIKVDNIYKSAKKILNSLKKSS